MRYWVYAEPAHTNSSEPVWVIMSDSAILAQYWDDWSIKMIAAKKIDLLDRETCIQDWVVTHWAQEATVENLTRIIQ